MPLGAAVGGSREAARGLSARHFLAVAMVDS
jgi:hypothetical protein